MFYTDFMPESLFEKKWLYLRNATGHKNPRNTDLPSTSPVHADAKTYDTPILAIINTFHLGLHTPDKEFSKAT